MNTPYRRYNMKSELVTWSQRRCEKCQRFLAIHQQKFCAKCKPVNDREVSARIMRERYRTNPEYRERTKFRSRIRELLC